MIKNLKIKKKHFQDDHDSLKDRRVNFINSALADSRIHPGHFDTLIQCLSINDNNCHQDSLDIQTLPGWNIITQQQQELLLNLAEKYLEKQPLPPTKSSEVRFTDSIALVTLKQLRPEKYACLSKKVWEHSSTEILKTIPFFQDDPLLEGLLEDLSKIASVVSQALIKIIIQELEGGHLSILNNWKRRLTDEQVNRIMQMSETMPSGKKHILYSSLVSCGKQEVVSRKLDSLFKDKDWNSLDDEEIKLSILAFLLHPVQHINQLLEVIYTENNLGKKWFESLNIRLDENVFLEALFQCKLDEVVSVYEWLHKSYPPQNAPRHGGVYFPSIIDMTYDLKSNIISTLTKNGQTGSTEALKSILSAFPNDTWLRDCILEAQVNEAASSVNPMNIGDITQLYEMRQSSKKLVNSVIDLTEIVIESLREYELALQRDGAIGDLWNIIKSITLPCNEEDLSDHLARYLKKSLKYIIINREVTIKRRNFPDGKPGARTDLWIQAVDSHGEIITLCIEVKCNWNDSAKTALKDQLIDKYLAHGAEAGILLLGWFACDRWDHNDSRKNKSTKVWPDKVSAQEELTKQAEGAYAQGANVSIYVLDCSLC